MLGCRRYQGLIAASLYEPLDPQDAEALERHLHRCARCRQDAGALRSVVRGIPAEPVAFHEDLLPALRTRIRQEAAVPRVVAFPSWRVALPAAFAACVLAIAYFGAFGPAGEAPVPAETLVTASPVTGLMAQAESLAAGRDYLGAAQMFGRIVEEYPDDPMADEAAQHLADVEFSGLRRYPEAYRAYDMLRNKYWPAYQRDPSNDERYQLLAECRIDNYRPLYELDAALNSGADAFAQLEQLIAMHPGRLVATRAVDHMHDFICGDLAPDTRAAALEMARDRCANPNAIAQLNMAIGEAYWSEMRDAERARRCYRDAASGGNMAVARMAREALAHLDAGTR